MFINIKVLLIDIFKLFWLYQSDVLELKAMISFSHYLDITVKRFPGIGQCIIARMQKRIQKPVKRLRWVFSWTYLQLSTVIYFWEKRHLRCLIRLRNTSGIWPYCLCWDQSVTVIWFKGLNPRFEWVREFGKVGLLLNHIKIFCLYLHYVQKCFRSVFLLTFSEISTSGGTTSWKLYFNSIKA